MRRAAFFDMDRTLVRVNTARLYLQWRVRRGEGHPRDLLPLAVWLLRYKFGLIDVEPVARQLTRTLAGQPEADFAAQVAGWVRREVFPHIAARGRAEVARRRRDGAPCVLLTSSTAYVAEPLARELGLEHVLCSRLVVVDGRFTGEPVSPLCYGPGKVACAQRWSAAHDVDLERSAFFTDSISDLPMLERVGEPVAVNPDPVLRLLASWRGWPVLRW